MIKLTRLNGETVHINCEMIESLESAPETLLSLTTGRKIMVTNPIDEVIDKIINYKSKILARVQQYVDK